MRRSVDREGCSRTCRRVAPAAQAVKRAVAETQASREAYAAQTKLHDLMVRSAAYPRAPEAAPAQALPTQRQALEAA